MKDLCFLLPNRWGIPDQYKGDISVRRTAAMGDCIAATVVCDKLIDRGYRVTYSVADALMPVVQLHPRIQRFTRAQFVADVGLDQSYEKHPARTRMSFSEIFIQAANRQLAQRRIILDTKNCRPRFYLPQDKAEPCLRFFKEYPKPWVIIVPRAAPQWHGRHVPNGIWQDAARNINGTCFWLGQDPGPQGIVDLHCRDIDMLAPLIWHADLVISVDTGPLHLAAALGKTILAILQNSSPELHLSDQVDFDMIGPDLACLNCQKNVCHINALTPPCQKVDPGRISAAANIKLQTVTSENISCVIPIWRPTRDRVNRCLEAVVPQVSEVVLTVDASGEVPSGINYGPKVRLVKARLPRIGPGPNMNHGARHTNGKYILLLNDDVVLKPDAVSRMREVMVNNVGLVGHLLYYPDNSIYHGGKHRAPGAMGWGHIDHRKHRPTITDPQETENVTGASIMVRRSAFFGVDGFDERYFLYNEDDDLCMKVRKAGWRIIYTPHAVGIHEEGQSTRMIGDTITIMKESQRLFAEKWRKYFEYNKTSNLGSFAYA